MGLSTLIEAKDKDVTGKSLSIENRRMFYRLRMWDRNSRSAVTSKSFQKAFTLLDAISSKLGLPESVVEESAYLFRKIASAISCNVLGELQTHQEHCKILQMQAILRKKYYKEHTDFLQKK